MPAVHTTPLIDERKLTELDYTRLHKLLREGASEPLDQMLCDAEVMPSRAIPADVVTMYARFVVRDLKLQREHTLEVCYPRDADAVAGRISVLSPAGTALIGLPVGAVAAWAGPNGETTTARIERIAYQPEASGDYLK